MQHCHQRITGKWLDDKSTTVGVGKGGVRVNTGRGKPGGTGVNVGRGGVGVHTGKPGSRTNVGVGKGGVTVGTGTRKGKPVYVRVKPGPNPFNYLYAATETQMNDNPNVALFFLEKDLHAGKRMNLRFSKSTNEATFLPRQVADSLPFSSNKLPEILDKFSVNPSKDVEAISTNAETGQKKEYRIVGVNRMPSTKAAVVCHRQEYAYAVFYCHETDTTVAYKVAMVAADGSKAEAVAVCHQDTAAWNPKHLAFQVLKVKPGTVPVCHFLPEDHIVWVPRY
ncbi:UNVERIFIED_CONTAM: BURP domain-containing protein 3 [Sesamum radiatum]|uniref:BURP domain-containing protein 3 n=1 Tax=Sesamum radiatum TaxID=300843 RepID=A0AAW2KZP8_SESRA